MTPETEERDELIALLASRLQAWRGHRVAKEGQVQHVVVLDLGTARIWYEVSEDALSRHFRALPERLLPWSDPTQPEAERAERSARIAAAITGAAKPCAYPGCPGTPDAGERFCGRVHRAGYGS